jgi:hypothetical protein
MAIPSPSLLQPGYRKEITFADQSFWTAMSGTFKPAWSLGLELKNFSRDTIRVFGTFIFEAVAWNNIEFITSQLPGKEIFIDVISNSEKLFHRWSTTIEFVQESKENSFSDVFYQWEFRCAFTMPFIELGDIGPRKSYISGWWANNQ